MGIWDGCWDWEKSTDEEILEPEEFLCDRDLPILNPMKGGSKIIVITSDECPGMIKRKFYLY